MAPRPGRRLYWADPSDSSNSDPSNPAIPSNVGNPEHQACLHPQHQEFDQEMTELHVEIDKLQFWVKHRSFERHDAASKGGHIRRIIERVRPRPSLSLLPYKGLLHPTVRLPKRQKPNDYGAVPALQLCSLALLDLQTNAFGFPERRLGDPFAGSTRDRIGLWSNGAQNPLQDNRS